jgi:hypothetical protein
MMSFQALAVEGEVLLLNPCLDPTPPTIQPWLDPLQLPRVWQTNKNISEASNFHLTTLSKLKSRNGFWGFPGLRDSTWISKCCKLGYLPQHHLLMHWEPAETQKNYLPWQLTTWHKIVTLIYTILCHSSNTQQWNTIHSKNYAIRIIIS